MNIWSQPTILLGSYGNVLFRRAVKLARAEARTHAHVIGISGSGKSRFLAGLYVELHKANLPATLIDPHGDLAHLVLQMLIECGAFKDKQAFKRILFLDIPRAARAGRYFGFNVLEQRATPHGVASNIMEAMHRAWPSLSSGSAPMFDTLIQNGVKALVSNKLPLIALYRFLTDKGYRDILLENEEDQDIVSVFHDWYDKLPARDQLDQSGSTLRRVNLLTFDPVLKYSLGQQDNLLDFRRILDTNQSVIINLAIENAEARRLLGSLITVSAEQGALSRADVPPAQRKGTHHLMIDEFSEFTAQSEDALARILSLTRKYGLYVVMAHQTFSQTSSRLQGALQNARLKVVFKLERPDAKIMAPIIGRVDPKSVRQNVSPVEAESAGMAEQWEEQTQALEDLGVGQAYVSYYRQVSALERVLLNRKPHRVQKVKTVRVPDPMLDPEELGRVEQYYLEHCFRPVADIKKELEQYRNVRDDRPVKRNIRRSH